MGLHSAWPGTAYTRRTNQGEEAEKNRRRTWARQKFNTKFVSSKQKTAKQQCKAAFNTVPRPNTAKGATGILSFLLLLMDRVIVFDFVSCLMAEDSTKGLN